MGVIYADIELQNGDDVALHRRKYIGEEEIRQIRVNMMVDTGAIMLTINEEIKNYLDLPIIGYRTSQLADGRRIELPIVGTVIVRYQDRFCTTNALVLPDDTEPLLGAIPMEEMDLWINPARGLLVPQHPDGPLMYLK